MNKAFGIVLFCAVVNIGCRGGGADGQKTAEAGRKAAEAAHKENVASLNEMVALMESITDETSAAAALPKLEKAATRAQEASKKLQASGLSEKELGEWFSEHSMDAVTPSLKLRDAGIKAMEAAPKTAKQLSEVGKKVGVGVVVAPAP